MNSVCGCAAGQARPGVALAVRHLLRPERLVTAFAGQDLEATARARSYFTGASPSSPSIGILRDGKLVYLLQRHEIQMMDARAVALRFADSLRVYGVGPDAAAHLRALNPDTVLAASLHLGPPGAPMFYPVVDGWVLPHAVDSTLASGKANLVPVIAGTNRDEGDEWMGAPTRTFARLMRARGVPTYVYMFSRVGDDSANRARGAYHSAEITFVFGRPHPLQPSAGSTPYDSTLAAAMSDYWVAFATSGDPNGPPTAGKLPRWPRYDSRTDALLELGPEIRPRTLVKRAVYDSLDAVARSRGRLRPR